MISSTADHITWEDGECHEDCPACHFPGSTCPIAPGECDVCDDL